MKILTCGGINDSGIDSASGNILGRHIRTSGNQAMEAGGHKVIWNWRDRFGREVARGIFFSRIEAGQFVMTRRMIILK